MMKPGTTEMLCAAEDFDLRDMIMGHGWVKLAPFAWHVQTGELTHRLEYRLGRACVWRATEVGQRELALTVEAADPLTDGDAQRIADSVRWALRMSDLFAPFHAMCREHPHLHGCAERRRGRLLRSPSVWEDVAKTVCTTCTTWPRTKAMVDALCRRYGVRAPDGEPAFPSAAAIAAVPAAELQRAAGLGYRARYLSAIAKAVATGEADLEALKTDQADTPDLRRRLLALPGIGPYAAANLLMLLGRYDHIALDSWVRRVVSKGWFGGRTPTDSEIHAAFHPFGPWKALVYWFWDWQSAAEEWTWRES